VGDNDETLPLWRLLLVEAHYKEIKEEVRELRRLQSDLALKVAAEPGMITSKLNSVLFAILASGVGIILTFIFTHAFVPTPIK